MVGEETPRLWRAFPSDPLGFGQILGHCATQCRVVVIADMVALTLRASWHGHGFHSHLSPAPGRRAHAPHISSTRTREETKVKLTSISKGIRKMCSASIAQHAVEHRLEHRMQRTRSSTAASGCRMARTSQRRSHPTMAALSRLCRCSCGRIWRPLMMRWSAMLNGGVTLA